LSENVRNITLIGAGNLATHLGKRLFKQGYIFKQVFSRSLSNAKKLAEKIESYEAIDDINQINDTADLYIIALPDDTISSLNNILHLPNKLVIHTAGALKTDVLNNISNRRGVFYPLQTFSKSTNIDFSNIPILITANEKKYVQILKEIAESISEDVRIISDEERFKIHLAAVFACNFTNYMYHIADDILAKENIQLDVLIPLIESTLEKIKTNKPIDVQTGPAIRGDIKTMAKHIESLEDNKKYKAIYKLISEAINNQIS